MAPNPRPSFLNARTGFTPLGPLPELEGPEEKVRYDLVYSLGKAKRRDIYTIYTLFPTDDELTTIHSWDDGDIDEDETRKEHQLTSYNN